MYGQVILSGLLYSASAWGGQLRTKKEKQRITSASRLALLRICSAPTTVSTAALEVVAGIPPISISILEMGLPPSDHRCEAFKADRLAVEATLGTFTPETCVIKMCGSKEALLRRSWLNGRRNSRSKPLPLHSRPHTERAELIFPQGGPPALPATKCAGKELRLRCTYNIFLSLSPNLLQ